MNENGASWSDILNTNIENVKLLFEVSEQKFFTQFLTKKLMSFGSLAVRYLNIFLFIIEMVFCFYVY